MAAFENRTIAEIRDLLLAAFQQEFNGVLRILPRSFIKIFCTVIAGVFIVLYKMIGWVFLQLFPETAYWKEVNVLGFKIRPLVKWGVLWGVGLPRPGTQWKGKIIVDVANQNTSLAAGTQLKSELTGKIYITDSPASLEEETAIIEITCADTGAAGSLSVGDILKFVSPLGNVKKEAVVTEITADGTDEETEGDYRYRVVNRYRVQPQGGALADYRNWSSEVPGVLNTYPYNDDDSPAGVLLYVSGNPAVFPDRIPSAALLIQVGDACTYNPETGRAERKPVTAILDPDNDRTYTNIRPVLITGFDIYIYGLSGIPASDFAGLVRPAVEDYFMGREPYIRGLSDDNNKTNVVSRNNVSSTVDQIALSVKAEFDAVSMIRNENPAAAYTLGRGELARLDRLFINGEEF
jgi:hypothetical protein